MKKSMSLPQGRAQPAETIMRKVVIGPKPVGVMETCRIGNAERLSVLDDLVELVLDENLFVLDVFAFQRGVGNDAAVDELLETHELAELALEIELVAFVGDQINIALTLVNDCQEFVDVDIAERPYCFHSKSSFQKIDLA